LGTGLLAGCDLTFESGTRDLSLVGPPHALEDLWQLEDYGLAAGVTVTSSRQQVLLWQGEGGRPSLLALRGEFPPAVTEFELPSGAAHSEAPDGLTLHRDRGRSLTLVWQPPGQPGRARLVPFGAAARTFPLPPDVRIKHGDTGALLYWDPQAPRLHVLPSRSELPPRSIDWPAALDPKARPDALWLNLDQTEEFLFYRSPPGSLLLHDLRAPQRDAVDLGPSAWYEATALGRLFFSSGREALYMYVPEQRQSFLIDRSIGTFRVVAADGTPLLVSCDRSGLRTRPLEPPQLLPPARTLDPAACNRITSITPSWVEYTRSLFSCTQRCDPYDAPGRILRASLDGSTPPWDPYPLAPIPPGAIERARCATGLRAYALPSAEEPRPSVDGLFPLGETAWVRGRDLWIRGRRLSDRAYEVRFSSDCRYLRWKEHADRGDQIGELITFRLPDGPRLRLGRNVGDAVELADGRLLMSSNLILSGVENRIVLVDEDGEYGRWLTNYAERLLRTALVPGLPELLIELAGPMPHSPRAVYRIPLTPPIALECQRAWPLYGVSRSNIRGNGIVSRTWCSPHNHPTQRSIPIPNPACGTLPYRRRSRYHSNAL
jgi:hypothetical protein